MDKTKYVFLGMFALGTALFLTNSAGAMEETDTKVVAEEGHMSKAWEHTKEAGSETWEATKDGASKTGEVISEKSGEAWDATKEGTGKAWDATKEGAVKAKDTVAEKLD